MVTSSLSAAHPSADGGPVRSRTPAGLAEGYADFVYAAALRQVREPHLAADVTQAVFLILQEKLPTLGPETIMTAWLLRTTRFTCLAALHRERRRRHHEQKAAAMRSEKQAAAFPDDWPAIIDAALLRLSSADRGALAGVYFEGLSHQEVAQRLGVSEATAHKRVQRALGKLRKILGTRGKLAWSAAAVAGALGLLGKPAAAPAAVLTGVTTSIRGTVPAGVAALVKGAAFMVKVLQIKAVAIMATVGVAVAVGGALLYQRAFAAAPPATASSPATAGTDPLAALQAYNRAVTAGDAEAAVGVVCTVSPQDEQVLAAWRDFALGTVNIRKALLAKFDEKAVMAMLPAALDSPGIPEQPLKYASATITGNRAIVTLPGMARQVMLLRRDGAWKVAISTAIQFAPGSFSHYLGDKSRKADWSAGICNDIEAGKFKTLEEADARIRLELGVPPKRAHTPELTPLEKRYSRIGDSSLATKDLIVKLDTLRMGQEADLREARAAIDAEKGDTEAVARDSSKLQEMQAKMDAAMDSQQRIFLLSAWQQVEAAVVEVRKSHGLSSEFPPGTPPFPDDAATPGIREIVRRRWVLELDDGMEKEVIKLLNDKYMKEKATGGK